MENLTLLERVNLVEVERKTVAEEIADELNKLLIMADEQLGLRIIIDGDEYDMEDDYSGFIVCEKAGRIVLEI